MDARPKKRKERKTAKDGENARVYSYDQSASSSDARVGLISLLLWSGSGLVRQERFDGGVPTCKLQSTKNGNKFTALKSHYGHRYKERTDGGMSGGSSRKAGTPSARIVPLACADCMGSEIHFLWQEKIN